MKIEKHGLYRIGERGHTAIIVDVVGSKATYRIVRRGARSQAAPEGREKTVGLANLQRLIQEGENGGVVHLCPRCIPDEAAVQRATWAMLNGGDGLRGEEYCPLCAGAGCVGLSPKTIRLGASTFMLQGIDERSGTAIVVDQDGNRFLPAWVVGTRWSAREWARLVHTAEHGGPPPSTPIAGVLEARLQAIRNTCANPGNLPLSAVPVVARIAAIATGELDRELGLIATT